MTSFKPESEVFEITDFTNVTDWERFTSRIEKILHELGVGAKKENTNGAGNRRVHSNVTSQNVELGSHTFTLSLFRNDGSSESERCDEDVQLAMQDWSHDFPERSHCLTFWFGVKQFITLSPASTSFSVSDVSLATQLLSSLAVAAGQVQCTVPFFVQVQRRSRQMYEGVWLSSDGLRTTFSVMVLPDAVKRYSHLNGLMELFNSELRDSRPPPAVCSARFTYLLRSWPVDAMYVEAPDMSSLSLGGFDGNVSLQLSATWFNMRGDVVSDNSVLKSLNAAHAPWWVLRALPHDADPSRSGGSVQRGEFNHVLSTLLQLCQRQEPLNDLLGRHAFQEDEPTAELQENVRSALERMAPPAMRAPTLSSLVQSAVVSSALEDSPLESDVMDYLMSNIFPDADAGPESEGGDVNSVNGGTEWTASSTATRVLFKSCPRDSLLTRITCVLIRVFCEHGGLRPLAYVWRELVLELRHRYENNGLLPDIPVASVPDMRYSLLQQKLQMLQCCIEHKQRRQSQSGRARESQAAGQQTELLMDDEDAGDGWNEAELDIPTDELAQDESDSEEFYEALEEQDSSCSRSSTTTAETGGSENGTSSNLTAEGVQSVSSDLRLLVGGAPLNIPVTQEVTPLTEDMLAEQQAFLAGLGTSDAARQLRARIQSSQLLADMEAFKAANPGCILGDFVRWYSPRDWVEDEQVSSEKADSELAEAGASDGQSVDGEGSDITSMDTDVTDTDKAVHEEAPEEWDVIQQESDASSADDTSGTSFGDEAVQDLVAEKTPDSELEHRAGEDVDGVLPVEDARAGASALHTEYTAPGRLSIRMRDPSTLWHQTWIAARATPAHRQRRLFDDTQEVEKVFQFLENLTVGQLMLHAAPVLAEHCMARIESLPEGHYDSVKKLLKSSAEHLSRVFSASPECLPQLADAVRYLVEAEAMVQRIHSICAALKWGHGQFAEGKDADELGAEQLHLWVNDLMEHQSVVMRVRGLKFDSYPALECAVRGLAAAQVRQEDEEARAANPEQGSRAQHGRAKPARFPEPFGREYILRVVTPHPGAKSRPTIQRMFAIIAPKEFRVATAYTTDTTFV